MSARVRKYEPGSSFNSLDDLFDWCRAGQYVFWANKPRPVHGAFVMSMQARIVAKMKNNARRASIRDEWFAVEAEKASADSDE